MYRYAGTLKVALVFLVTGKVMKIKFSLITSLSVKFSSLIWVQDIHLEFDCKIFISDLSVRFSSLIWV